MMNKIILFFLVLMIIPLVSAEVYETSTEVDLKQQCFKDGAFCNSTTMCNFTVTDPDNNIIINNLEATNQLSYHNYTLQSWETNTSGIWTYTVTCDDGVDQNFNEFSFTINPAGIDFSQQRTDAFSRGIWFLAGLSILFFIGGFMVQFTPLKWSLFLLAGIFIIMGTNLVLVGLTDEVVNENVISLFDTFVAGSWYIVWFAVGIIFIMWFIAIWINLSNVVSQKKKQNVEGVF